MKKLPALVSCFVLALVCAPLAVPARASTYVVCANSNNIQVLSSTGANGTPIPCGNLGYPVAIAIDQNGILYVSNDQTPYTIEKFSPAGADLGAFTTGGTLNRPYGLAFDSAGNLYVANLGNNTVEKFSSTGTDLGAFISAGSFNGLSGVVGIAFDGTGNFYAVNSFGNSVAKYTSAGTLTSTFNPSTLSYPYRIAFDTAGNFYVTNFNNNNVEKFSAAGADQGTFATANLDGPVGLTFDNNGNLYVCSEDVSNVEEFSAMGADLGALGSVAGSNPSPSDIAFFPGGQIQFSAPSYTTFEDAGAVTITATRVGGASGATSLTYTTEDGTALAGADYTQTGGLLSWADGDATPKSFTVPIIDRGITTGQSVNFSVTSLIFSGAATLGMPSSATVTITDNDTAPPPAGVLQFSAPSYTTFEDAGAVNLTVSRVSGSSGSVSVVYTTTDGTAVAGADYTAATGILTWADGDASSKIIAVPILDRQITSATPVAFNVTLGLPTGGATLGTPNPATVSISDNDTPAQPTVTLAYSVNSQISSSEPPNTIPAGTVLQFFADISDPSNQLSQVEFTLDGALIGTLPNDGGLYPQNVTFPDRGTHTVEAVATSLQGGMSTSAATFTVYAEPTITYCTLPPSVTIGEQTPFQFECSVYDPDDQMSGPLYFFVYNQDGQGIAVLQTSFIGADGNYVFTTPDVNGHTLHTILQGDGTFQLEPVVTAKDGSTILSGTRNTITIVASGSTSDVAVAKATLLAGLDHVNVPADDVLSVVVMFTPAIDSTGASVPPAVTRVDFYVDGVLFASRDGNGNPIPLSVRGPGRGPITRDASAAGSTNLFEATYQVPTDPQQVTITAVSTTSDGLSQFTAPLHVTPVVETGAPPVATLGPLTGGQPVAAGASLVVPVTVSAPSIPVAMVQYYLNGALVSTATAPPYGVSVTPPTAGPYALTAVVTDTNGVATFAEPLAFQAVPAVSLSVKGDGKAVVDGENGKVVFTRTGDDLSAPLTVFFKLTGTAVDGVNYTHVGKKAVIPAGTATYKLKIKPLDTKTGPLALKVGVKLLPAPDGSYAPGAAVKAKLMLEQTQ